LRGVFRFSTSPAYAEYEAQVARDPFFSDVEYAFRTSVDTVEYYNLAPGTDFYWRVIGFLPGGRSDIGASSTFTTTTSTNVSEGDTSAGDLRTVVSNDGITIHAPLNGVYSVRVFDLQGRRLGEEYRFQGGRSINLPFTALMRGCYLLEIHGDTTNITKVVVLYR
jgi:hypothetical protein